MPAPASKPGRERAMRISLKTVAVALTVGGVCALICLAAQMGTLKLKTDGVAWVTMAMTNNQTCSFGPPDFSAQLPADKYRPRVLWVFATEDIKQQDGTTRRIRWDITSSGPWGDLSRIDVKENATTEVKLGPPFLLKGEASQNDDVVGIQLVISGQGGETYSPSVVRAGESRPPPGLDIVDEKGKTITSGSFEYG